MHQSDADDQKTTEQPNGKASPEPIGFLVVTRKIGEGIVIGNDIHVLVNKIKDNQVRLAIYAPKSVIIGRSVLADSKRLRSMGRKSHGRDSG